MTNSQQVKIYDLEDRTYQYARSVLNCCKEVPKNSINFSLINQVIRASGSVGANYIEANEALSKKDFYHRIKICLKEVKEARYWLRLINESEEKMLDRTEPLINESTELLKIFSSIINK